MAFRRGRRVCKRSTHTVRLTARHLYAGPAWRAPFGAACTSEQPRSITLKTASAPLVGVHVAAPDSIDVGVPAPLLPHLPAPTVPITLPTLPPLGVKAVVTDGFEAGREAESSADAAELERLQGVYVGQIRGRLARVLEMAASAAPHERRPCAVQVIQGSERGEVMDVNTSAPAKGARGAGRVLRWRCSGPHRSRCLPRGSHRAAHSRSICRSTEQRPRPRAGEVRGTRREEKNDKDGVGTVLGWAALALAGLSSPAAHAAVGRTAGSATCRRAGEARYTIPIFAPPGTHGMAPQLALVSYTAAGAAGMLSRGRLECRGPECHYRCARAGRTAVYRSMSSTAPIASALMATN